MVRAIFELKLLPVLGKRVSVSIEGLYWSLGSALRLEMSGFAQRWESWSLSDDYVIDFSILKLLIFVYTSYMSKRIEFSDKLFYMIKVDF